MAEEDRIDHLMRRLFGDIGAISETDPLLPILLRGHLLSEAYFDQIIDRHTRSDRFRKSAGLEYHQKLHLVREIGPLQDSVFSGLKRLNKLRNELAHDPKRRLSEQALGSILEAGGQGERDRSKPLVDQLQIEIVALLIPLILAVGPAEQTPKPGS